MALTDLFELMTGARLGRIDEQVNRLEAILETEVDYCRLGPKFLPAWQSEVMVDVFMVFVSRLTSFMNLPWLC